MKVVVLAENTSRNEALKPEFGLSFYIETFRHKILFDTGAKGGIVENAAVLGIDLPEVDIVVLSHGHYDHGGGLEAFLRLNGKASVYVQQGAFGDYYSRRPGGTVYIGLDKSLENHPQIFSVKGDLALDDGLFLFSGIKGRKFISETNSHLLYGREGKYSQDVFDHEQNLWIREQGRNVLFAGCAHCGIVNIMERFEELAGTEPDMVFGGFHLSNPRMKGMADRFLLEQLSEQLLKRKSSYYTCHCTGVDEFHALHSLMGERIRYVGTGDRVEV